MLRPLLIALTLTAGAALAHSGVMNPAVKTRMMSMEAIGNHAKTVGEMMKGEAPFDAGAARAAFAGIADEAARVPELFMAPEMDPKSEALPVIWERYDDFTAKSDRLVQVAMELSQSFQAEDDTLPAMKALGDACKACHKTYRK